MFLGTVARAKTAGTATVCRSNLRQLIVATQLYTGDHAVFPTYIAARSGEEPSFWSQALESYAKSAWPATDLIGHPFSGVEARQPRGIFNCPAYDRLPGYYLHPKHSRGAPLGSYAYNRSGTGHPVRGPALGLGGKSRARIPANPADVQPTPESAVVRPENLFAFADAAFVPRYQAGSMKYAGTDEFSPFILPWLAMELGIRSPGAIWNGARDITKRRHSARFTIAFADGHVEVLATKRIFSSADEVLRRWNIDDAPHRDEIPMLR